MRSNSRKKLIFFGLVAVVSFFFLYIGFWFRPRPIAGTTEQILEDASLADPGSSRTFFGKVIDQGGNPVGGTEIKLIVSELLPHYWVPGGIVPARRPEDYLTVTSDKRGMFWVKVALPKQDLEIIEISKSGYKWAWDLSWQVGSNFTATYDNREFIFKGRYLKYPIYSSDPDNPAIFPLQKNGSGLPTTRLSRGGSDLLPDGTIRINEPRPLMIPTTGPDAPVTNDDVAKRFDQYSEQLRRERQERDKKIPPIVK